MKYRCVILFLSLVLMSIGLYADTGVVDGVTWVYQINQGGARLTARSASPGNLVNYVIPETLGGCQVTTIGSAAFSGYTNLVSVTIPTNVTTIEGGAFQRCPSLASVQLPENLTAIGPSAFAMCFGVSTIEIPGGVTNIGYQAFYGCTNLLAFTVAPNNERYYSENGFLCDRRGGAVLSACPAGLKTVEIPSSIRTIGVQSFSGCLELETLTFPDGVHTILPTAIGGCPRLKTINLPKTLSTLAQGVITSCATLEELVIPASVRNIQGRFISGCPRLRRLSIQGGGVNIATNAVQGCTGLVEVFFGGDAPIVPEECCLFNKNTTVYVPLMSQGWNTEIPGMWMGMRIDYDGSDGTTARTYSDGVLNYDLQMGMMMISGYDESQFSSLSSEFILPSSFAGVPVVGVRDFVFRNSPNISSVQIPEGYTTIGEGAFERCSNLSGLSLPSTLESIGNSAFRECVNLTRVEIPVSVGHIGYFAFRDCRNLTEVDIANPACAVMSGAFDGTPVYRLSPESVNPIAPESQIVTNFVYGIVTNVVHTFSEVTNVIHTASTSTVNHYTVVTNRVEVSESVTNYVYTYSVVTNVVTYVPEAGSSPLDVYPAKAGGDAAQVVAGAAGWDALDLPEGMTWDRETGALGGTPVRSGVYDVILVSGSGANTRMMRTTINVAGFDPVVGYVGTSFAWKGAPMTMLDSYKNLPAGLKWTASAGTLAGVPTKAGDYSRATTYGDAVPFTVEELPVTAVGTFNGLVSLGGTNYPLTVTTTKAGKLTAKIVLAAKTLSLTASSWGGWSRGADGHLLFSATLSTKTDSLDVVLDADAAWNADQLSAAVTAGTLAGASGSAQRNAFAADADAKAAASEAAGTFTLDLEAVPGGYRLVAPEAGAVGPMTVDLKVTGAATLKGKVDAKTSLSATATLHVGPDGARSLVFFFKGSQFTWSW